MYVQVSQDAAGSSAAARGVQGRLIPFRAAGGRYAWGRVRAGHLDGRVSGNTWLLVDGAAPAR